ncbi:type VII secretion protein EccE [Mycobacterium sp. 1164966.3]|uniref:type VII secretion protein EccE n=1 Tax=Mycobacterium sp. 1164966.3 TaxID=1856861 RepID=UPI0007FFBF27|nr:type VII secretion protein EccE [Mycobacterium sp. 1164966.3]OBA83836.1 type VII secretion protein EccE [Mycobacterium sp. 1164966.3]
MSQSIVWPGTGRITLALLAVVPAAMAYPWNSNRDYWLIGIAAAVVIVLFSWWRGLHLTTILGRRLAMLFRRRHHAHEFSSDTSATALLRVGPSDGGPDVFPLPLVAGYLNRYGIRADKVRITSRGNASGTQETWVGLTISAVDNLAALQARSSRIPLHQTTQVAARRLADHLREIGWEAGVVGAEEAPRLVTSVAREKWRGLPQGSDYLAAYRVAVDGELPETLQAIRSHPSRETWTALEIAGEPTNYTVAAACAFRTERQPGSAPPLAGLVPQRGNQLPALTTLNPLSTRRLDGHTAAPADLLTSLNWPTPLTGAHRAPLTEAAPRS